MAWSCLRMIDKSTKSLVCARVCDGERAVASLSNGRTELLLRAVLSVSSCNAYRDSSGPYAEYFCRTCRCCEISKAGKFIRVYALMITLAYGRSRFAMEVAAIGDRPS